MGIRALVFAAICLLALFAGAAPTEAQETEPGDPCGTVGLFRVTGGPENPDGHLVYCDGSNWQTILGYSAADGQIMFGSAGLAAAPLHVYGEAIIWESGLACTAAAEGAIRYLSAGIPPWEFCDGSAWLPFKQPRCVNDDTGECYLATPRSGDDPEFIAANIVGGINILGVSGTLAGCTDNDTTQCILEPTRSNDDPEFIATSILSGINILGVTGTATGSDPCTDDLCGSGSPPGLSKISAGQLHSCVIHTGGRALCWGDGGVGRLGNGDTTFRILPDFVSSTDSWSEISADLFHSCGIKTDGTAWCWGEGSLGRLGNGGFLDQFTPMQVSGAGSWSVIDAGGDHSCGIKTTSAGYCWGRNTEGQVGNGAALPASQENTPVQVSGTWNMISARATHSCGIKTDNTAWCWGRNDEGQLGNGAALPGADQSTPVQVTGAWSAISAGGDHSCGIKTDNTAWCWGTNTYGEIGSNGTVGVNQSTPVQVPGAWSAISAGYAHSCGIKTDNTAWCWGYNLDNQLGDGTATHSSTPVQVSDAGPWAAISAGSLHSCGRKTNDAIVCWGDPTYTGLRWVQPVDVEPFDKPNFFNFTDLTDQLTSRLATSDILLISGLGVPVDVSISGGGSPQFQICTASDCSTVRVAWGSTTVQINNGEYLQLRMTTSASLDTTLTATVNVGQGSDSWRTTTVAVMPKMVFVSSATYKGNNGGPVSSSANCQSLATAASLSGTFKAWMSFGVDAASSPASTFTQATENYALVDGTVVANGWTDLTDGSIDNPINLDENGNPVSGQTWTGTFSDGTDGAADADCSGWSVGGGGGGPGAGGYAGDIASTGNWWSYIQDYKCGSSLHVYCFEQ